MSGFNSGSGITGILLRTEYLGEREQILEVAGGFGCGTPMYADMVER